MELFRYAKTNRHLPEHATNPALEIPVKPVMRSRSYDHLEILEAAAFLEALFRRSAELAKYGRHSAYTHALSVAVMESTLLAYTGARPEEASQIVVGDMNFVRRLVRLVSRKKPGRTEEDDTRHVPMFPYLAAVAEAYLLLQGGPRQKALLVSTRAGRRRDGKEIPVQDMRKIYGSAKDLAADLLDEWDVAHGLRDKHIVPRSWRPTYCSARVQTTDNGAPVAVFTVQAEMGHRSTSMINAVYNRLGRFRPRGPHVEYRLPDGTWPGESVLREALGERRFEEIMEGGIGSGVGRSSHLRLLS